MNLLVRFSPLADIDTPDTVRYAVNCHNPYNFLLTKSALVIKTKSFDD